METRFDDVMQVSRDPENFHSAPSINIGDIPPEIAEWLGSMINMDAPKHTKLRLIVNRGFTPPGAEWHDFTQYNMIFAVFYGGVVLRTVVFFGCAWIFMNLFRGDIIDRSLHFYFLSPVRREVLVTGKYLSGLVTTIILFTATTVICMLLIYLPHFPSESSRFFFDGPGMGQLLTYASVTILACIGYGAFFLVVGLFFRNPIVPAIVLYVWEWLNFLMPPLLKKISVIHYLNSLVPVPVSEGPFAVVAEPTPAWIAVPSLIIVTALVLIVASYRIRHMEIRYGNE